MIAGRRRSGVSRPVPLSWSKLSLKEKDSLRMFYLEGLSAEEMKLMLEVKQVKHVWVILHRIRRKLGIA